MRVNKWRTHNAFKMSTPFKLEWRQNEINIIETSYYITFEVEQDK